MKKLGLGQYYDIEINDKSKGVVPNIEWKLKRDGLQWSMGETLNASINSCGILERAILGPKGRIISTFSGRIF